MVGIARLLGRALEEAGCLLERVDLALRGRVFGGLALAVLRTGMRLWFPCSEAVGVRVEGRGGLVGAVVVGLFLSLPLGP